MGDPTKEGLKPAEALGESPAQWSLIYNHTTELLALFTIRPEGTGWLVSINRPLQDFARWISEGRAPSGEETDLQGLTPDAFARDVLRASPEVAHLLAERCNDVIRSGQPVTFEVRLDQAGGPIDIEQRVEAVDDSGGGRYLLWAGRDISDRAREARRYRQLEAQLLQSQMLETLASLAGGIAQDFNNILTGITGYLDRLLSEPSATPVVLEHTRSVLHGIERATDLVRRVLTFSRQKAPQPRPVHLPAVLDRVLQLLAPGIPLHIKVQLDLKPSVVEPLPPILADEGQMQQIVMNLCNNAIQALGQQPGTVLLSMDPVTLPPAEAAALRLPHPGPHVRLTLADDGPGVDAQALPDIFDPFSSTRPPGIGTALGLAIVRHLVQSLHGGIRVRTREDTPNQRGTLFEIFFPTVGPGWAGLRTDTEPLLPPPAPLLRAEPERASPEGGLRVLLVDDHAALISQGTSILERLGCRVRAFTDPLQALSVFHDDPFSFDLVITDQAMPALMGIDLARTVLRLRPELPIVLTTEQGMLDESVLGEGGPQGVLIKPFQIDAVVEMLKQLLGPDA